MTNPKATKLPRAPISAFKRPASKFNFRQWQEEKTLREHKAMHSDLQRGTRRGPGRPTVAERRVAFTVTLPEALIKKVRALALKTGRKMSGIAEAGLRKELA